MGIDPTVSRREIESPTQLIIIKDGRLTYCGVNACLAYCLNSVLNVKALVGAFNQKKALVGTFSVIVKLQTLLKVRFQLY